MNTLLVLLFVVGLWIGWPAMVTYKYARYSNLSWKWAMIAILPSVLMVLSFYALAIHMYHSLGGWPQKIGEEGFPPSLLLHQHIQAWYFSLMLIFILFLYPLVSFVCLSVSRWRGMLPYISFFGVSFGVGLFVMFLGPSKFVNWWTD